MAQEEIDALPDGMVGLSEMHEYGYSWDEMLPLTKDMASELFGEDVSVYQLHADGSETIVEDRAALQEHDGLFGVEKGDWNAYKEYRSMKQELEDSEPNREAQLLYGNEGRFGIYQLKDSAETRDIRFMDMDYLEKEGIPVSRENYTLVYTGELKEGMSLEDIYTKFNVDHPADFTGHSLSVSDVVVLHQDGENTSHYVDSVGYREIPEFTKELSISAEMSKEEQTVVTLTVAECGEFHNFGEYHEGIAGIEEAIAIFNRIPPERMNGIPSIGINIHTEGTESYEDTQMDIVSGRVADLEILDYVPDITDNPKAVEVIAELIDKLPDIEVRGSLEKWQAAFLAAEIDQLSYNYDTVQYNQTVEDREAQLANITEDIRNGNTGYLNDFLNAFISDSIREGMTDIIGKGTELDDSEGVQTARKAKELLDKLAEYKPLAKIEELEECNYNMIDNVLNNEKPKEEKQTGRISIKEKLAEKKAVIEQRDKAEKEAPEKGTEKKSEREI